MKELIEKIGGRDRMEYILIHEARFSHDTIIMARALLAVLDAQEKPIHQMRLLDGGENSEEWVEVTEDEFNTPTSQMFGNWERRKVYTTPPAASVPDGWIKCSDRLPESDKVVLCGCFFDGPHDFRIKTGGNVGGVMCIIGGSWDVTHWMPLPASPAPENKK